MYQVEIVLGTNIFPRVQKYKKQSQFLHKAYSKNKIQQNGHKMEKRLVGFTYIQKGE